MRSRRRASACSCGCGSRQGLPPPPNPNPGLGFQGLCFCSQFLELLSWRQNPWEREREREREESERKGAVEGTSTFFDAGLGPCLPLAGAWLRLSPAHNVTTIRALAPLTLLPLLSLRPEPQLLALAAASLASVPPWRECMIRAWQGARMHRVSLLPKPAKTRPSHASQPQ